MVEAMLKRYVGRAWAGKVDFSSLELMNSHFVSEEYQQRESDLIWRVRLKGSEEHLYVYLLIELQSTVDRFMALRLLVYLLLFYQWLIRQGKLTPGGLLPAVFPLVVYNGSQRWSAASELAELIEDVPELERFVPHFEYLVLDVGRLPGELLEPLDDPATAIFRFEQSQSLEDLESVVEALAQMPLGGEGERIRRDFATWLRRVILPKTVPGERLPQMRRFEEIKDMLAERVKEWPKEWEAKGLKKGLDKGRREGRREGREEGLRKLLVVQLEAKFGSLSAADKKLLKGASQKTLTLMGTRLLTASSLDEVFTG